MPGVDPGSVGVGKTKTIAIPIVVTAVVFILRMPIGLLLPKVRILRYKNPEREPELLAHKAHLSFLSFEVNILIDLVNHREESLFGFFENHVPGCVAHLRTFSCRLVRPARIEATPLFIGLDHDLK